MRTSRAQEREDGARKTRDEEARRRTKNLNEKAKRHKRRRELYDKTFSATWKEKKQLSEKVRALEEFVRRVQKDLLPDATRPLGEEEWNAVRRDAGHPLNADQAEVVPTPARPGEPRWYTLGDVIRNSALVDSEDAVSMDTDSDRKNMARTVEEMRAHLGEASAPARVSEYLNKVADFREESMWLIVSGSFRRYADNPFPGSSASVAFDDQVYTVRTRSPARAPRAPPCGACTCAVLRRPFA
jgi:hypothetical protein